MGRTQMQQEAAVGESTATGSAAVVTLRGVSRVLVLAIVGCAVVWGAVPVWFAILVPLPDLASLMAVPLLRTRGLTSLPEHVLSGTARSALLIGVPLLFLTGDDSPLGDTVASLAAVLGWAIALWGLLLHWCTGALHLWQVRTVMQQVPPVLQDRRRRATSSSAGGARRQAR